MGASSLLHSSWPAAVAIHRRIPAHSFNQPLLPRLPLPVRVAHDSRTPSAEERCEADKLVDTVDFGQLCNDFQCISSPLVESTARQLARDLLELRLPTPLSLAAYALSVKYKDPVRSFTGREKYRRPLWVRDALENPSVAVQEMVMLSTSELCIKWTLKGKPKFLIASMGGDLVVRVTSRFTFNQISGQVLEHEELWDLSASPVIARAFFWTSRRLFATVEAGKDLTDAAKKWASHLAAPKENLEMHPDPTADPTKFFQRDDGFQRDAYQIALLLVIVYFVVELLRTTL